MPEVVKLDNGNIVYVVEQKESILITLNFSIKKITIGDETVDPSNGEDDLFDISLALHNYLKGEKGVDEDTAIKNFMKEITKESQKWIDDNGLKGKPLEHTLVRPNEWVDDYIIYSTVKFNIADFSNHNYAKLKNAKIYQEILKGTGPTMYSIDIDMVLPN